MNEYRFAPYSFSKIATHIGCPRKFKFVSIDERFFEKGKFYHWLIEHFPTPPPDKFTFTFACESEQNDFLETVKRFIQTPHVNDLLKKYSLRRELPFFILPDFSIGKQREGSLFTGYIDYVGQEEPGSVLVIDWKSKKHEKFPNTEDQLMAYALWIFLASPDINVIDASFYYIETPEEIKYRYTRENDMNRLKDSLINKIQVIENDFEFQRKITKNCNRCEYFNQCEPFKNMTKRRITKDE